MTRFVVVTGTSTDVGKTIVTAALATVLPGRVLVVKPVQTGAADDPGDAATVARLAGVDVLTFTTLDEPLAPDTAARRAGVDVPRVAAHAARVREEAAGYDVVVVEGAGGLLVRLDADGGTLLDLAADLTATHPDTSVVLVCAAGLGTLNHSELTVGALRSRGLDAAGLVIGSWPAEPGLAERCNRDDLPRVTGVPLVGVLPAGAGVLSPASFTAAAPDWLDLPR
ncbi:dethiobiotin synthase [Nocardioides marinquilinus]|uniref:ATP-dependent dethiobiotin synthetase BioD n=1 Tax=Nocardioides marinquilinus TaxID=1210400 RepID=A0ABP9PR01_9ACTN